MSFDLSAVISFEEPHISELVFKLLKVPLGCFLALEDDGLMPSGTLHLSNAVANFLEPTPGF